MALTQISQIIDTLGDALSWLARYAGGTIPSINDSQYQEWVSWLNEGQEYSAESGHWGRLLTKTTLSITANEPTATLPDDFHKRTGVYVLAVDGVDWNQPNNTDGQKLYVNKNTDGEWIVNFLGFTPEESKTATLWYFRHSGKLNALTDHFMLDGKMACFYALTEYFRQAGEYGSLDDARAEFDNRFNENLSNEMLPTPQELLGFIPYYQYLNQSTNERNYYSRSRRRR